MTSFNLNITNDDAGLHTRPIAGRTVKEMQAYSGAHATQEEEKPTEAPIQTHYDDKRRKRDRRHQHTAVLLDTRSGHDRRNISADEAFKAKNETGDTTPSVDVYT